MTRRWKGGGPLFPTFDVYPESKFPMSGRGEESGCFSNFSCWAQIKCPNLPKTKISYVLGLSQMHLPLANPGRGEVGGGQRSPPPSLNPIFWDPSLPLWIWVLWYKKTSKTENVVLHAQHKFKKQWIEDFSNGEKRAWSRVKRFVIAW